MYCESRILRAVAALALVVTGANADAIYVCWDGSGDYVTIREGIDAAQDGDEVVVCDGTYTGDGNRDLDLSGKLITLRSENGPDNCIIDCENDGRGFYFHSGETDAAVLEGFTIRNGSAIEANGGGILCESSSPTIRNCILTQNTATGGAVAFTGIGGGMACVDGSNPKIHICTFSHNSVIGGSVASTGYGGGLSCTAGSNPIIEDCTFSQNGTVTGSVGATGGGGGTFFDASSPILRNCAIAGNTSDGTAGYAGHGAGMFVWNSSNPTIEDCMISGNAALGLPGTVSGTGGGMFSGQDSHPQIDNCTFSGNTANRNGGGMWCGWASWPVLTNCTFSDNSAGLYGGGMINKAYASPVLIDCTFSGNSAAEYGGGMFNWYASYPFVIHCRFSANRAYNGGGMFNNDQCSPVVANCIFSGNLATGLGGGMVSIISSNPTVANCTFSGNSAVSGGGLYNWGDSAATLVNCILWDNTPDEIVDAQGSAATVSYSDVQGGWPGEGNIDADPLFVSGPLGHYYLSQTAAGQDEDSPCVDVGSDTAENLGLDTRTTRTDQVPDSGIVDMGYHYPIVCLGDLNDDDKTDQADLGILLADWGCDDPVNGCVGDLNGDDKTDQADLGILLADWGCEVP